MAVNWVFGGHGNLYLGLVIESPVFDKCSICLFSLYVKAQATSSKSQHENCEKKRQNKQKTRTKQRVYTDLKTIAHDVIVLLLDGFEWLLYQSEKENDTIFLGFFW